MGRHTVAGTGTEWWMVLWKLSALGGKSNEASHPLYLSFSLSKSVDWRAPPVTDWLWEDTQVRKSLTNIQEANGMQTGLKTPRWEIQPGNKASRKKKKSYHNLLTQKIKLCLSTCSAETSAEMFWSSLRSSSLLCEKDVTPTPVLLN